MGAIMHMVHWPVKGAMHAVNLLDSRDRDTFGAMKIADLRKTRNMSQKELAEALGISQSKVSRAETMDDSAMLDTYRRIAEYFDVPLLSLFEQDDSESEKLMLRLYRALPPDARESLIDLMARMQGLPSPKR